MAADRSDRSYGPWLPAVRSHLAADLCDDPSWSRAASLIDHLGVDGLVALEAYLGERRPARRLDVSFRVDRPERAVRLREGLSRAPHTSRSAAVLDTWIAAPWRPDPVPALWLEFDLDAGAPAIPAPSVCARLGRAVPVEFLTDVLFPALHGRSLSSAQQAAVGATCEPGQDGRPLYAFSLHSRGDNVIRLESYGERLDSFDAILAWLPAASTAALREVAPLVAGADRFHLSFDVGPQGPHERLGLEAGFRRQPRREAGWRRLVDRLVAAGLVRPAEAEAALHWSGWDAPRALRDHGLTSRMIGGRSLARGLSHVKLVTMPSAPPEAKVYLVFDAVTSSQAPGPRSSVRGSAITSSEA